MARFLSCLSEFAVALVRAFDVLRGREASWDHVAIAYVKPQTNPGTRL